MEYVLVNRDGQVIYTAQLDPSYENKTDGIKWDAAMDDAISNGADITDVDMAKSMEANSAPAE